jgi:hypothetical protein
MAGFNMADYEPVEARLARAHADRNDLRVITDIVMHDDKAVIVKATIYKSGDDLEHARPWATGYAQESIGSSNITRTSWLEVCETSAIGRALANAGYAPKGARASREEMQKASRQTTGTGRGRPAARQSEAAKQGDPTLVQITELAKQLDEVSKAEFIDLHGAKPSEIKDPQAALKWLSERVEPF